MMAPFSTISPKCCVRDAKPDGRCLPRKTLSATSIASLPDMRISAIAASPAAVEMAAIVSPGTIERFTPASSRTGLEGTAGFHHRHVISISYSQYAATEPHLSPICSNPAGLLLHPKYPLIALRFGRCFYQQFIVRYELRSFDVFQLGCFAYGWIFRHAFVEETRLQGRGVCLR